VSFRETRSRVGGEDPGQAREGDERAYVLLEEARLRCERLGLEARTDAERISMELIHKELGMAGWLASSEIDSGRRLELLATAHDRSTETMLQPPKNHALAGVASSAEDAVAEGLAGSGQSDHMHLAHLHLLRALELLAGHL
jgi:hypothetical protein